MNSSVCLLVALFGCAVAYPVDGDKLLKDHEDLIARWRELPLKGDGICIIKNAIEEEDDVKKIVPMTEEYLIHRQEKEKGDTGEHLDFKDETVRKGLGRKSLKQTNKQSKEKRGNLVVNDDFYILFHSFEHGRSG